MSDTNGSSSNIVALVKYLVTSLVDSPDAVVVDAREEDGRLSVIINVDSEDVGKVIGRSGRTIKSIRTLARAAGSSADVIVDVDVEG